MKKQGEQQDSVFGRISRLEDIFRDILSDADHFEGRTQSSGCSPRIDIAEKEDSYLIIAELPGVEKDDIDISLENNIISIKGEKTRNTDDDHEEFIHVERVCGTFFRSFKLPETVEAEGITAEYSNGVLKLDLRKRKGSTSKKIEIK